MKYKFISFINLFGLTVGLSCCLLILAYILHELSYDRYHSNARNIYRVERSWSNPETGMASLELGSIAPAIGPLMENDFEQIQQLSRLVSFGTQTMHYEEKTFNEQDVYFADEHFFSLFDVEMLAGNQVSALSEPNTVMLSEELAGKYFGNADPLNKVIRLGNQLNFKVTGVFKAFPQNAHFHPNLLLSFKTLHNPEIYGEENLRTNWSNNDFFTYILLPEGYAPEKLKAQFPAFLNRHITEEGSGSFKPSDWTSLELMPLTAIHLHSHKDQELETNGDIQRVYIFSAIALFILLIACINYMNLSTARSVLRAKEIGVRKVIGAGKKELVTQFLCESVLITWLATLLAIGLCWLVLPWLNQLSGQELPIGILLNWKVLLPLLMVPFVVGILSGIYPALFLSSFQPVKVLKGFSRLGNGGVGLRQLLVVAQFSISIILIISTLVVYHQLQYLQSKSLGYDREHVISFRNLEEVADNFDAFRNELLSNIHIKEIGRSSRIPTGRLLDGRDIQVSRGDSQTPVKLNVRDVQVDDHFMATYGIKLVAGRSFSPEFGSDSTAVILNEAAVKELKFNSPEAALGSEFQYEGRKGQLVGVVNDFHFESMHQRILPMVFYPAQSPQNYSFISVKISGDNMPAALAHIENTWKDFVPEVPYEHVFLEERYASLYESEQRQGTVFTLFACIAIAIACLGLFGLSAFTISQRVKEIGIRKVLGAETSNIVAMLSKDFLKLVLLAALIAVPVGWYVMHKWLEDFAYRINIPLWVFLAAAVVAALVAFLTISYQAVKAATANPVNNLRTE